MLIDRPIAYVREHIAVFTVLLSTAAATGVMTPQAIGEGGEAPLFFAVSLLVAFGGFLAFCLICNAVLHIAISRKSRPSRRADTRIRRATRTAVIAAALALPAAAVLRDPIWLLLGHHDDVNSFRTYAAIVLITAPLIGLLAFASVVALPTKRMKTKATTKPKN